MPKLTRGHWTTPDRARHFLLPEAADLPEGDLPLRTASGRECAVDPGAAAPYEVTEAEAKAWLEGQLESLLGEARSGVLGFVGRLREKTAAMREERQRTVEDFMRQARSAPDDPPPDTP